MLQICIRTFAIVVILVLLLAGLFVLNGVGLARNEVPYASMTSYAKQGENLESSDILKSPSLKIMAYNVAKGFVHKGGFNFADKDEVIVRLQKIAEVINAEQPDLVFLSEIVFECGPSPVNQVTFLAEATGMHTWLFGENYNFGLPFYRIVGGNAILARLPVRPVDNPSLVGRKPFYVTKNNRRILWGELRIHDEVLLLGAIHTDSYGPKNNLAQTRQIIEYLGERPAILAGDFNARPGSPSMQLLQESGRFIWAFDGPLTFPADHPEQKIDFILAPAAWKLLEHRVIHSDASDHLAVVSVFHL